MEQVVSFLFKYSTSLLSKGQFGFSARPSVWLLAIFAVALAAFAYFLYSAKSANVGPGWRAVLIALRCGLVLLVVFCLMRPVVVIPSVVPQSSYVFVLVDDSESMTLPADHGSRLEQVRELLKSDGPLMGPLAEKFKLRELRFSQAAERIDDAGQLTGAGTLTDIDAALEQASRESAGLPASGIVLITDGGDNNVVAANDGDRQQTDRWSATLSALKGRGLPVYAIGVGQLSLPGDVELVRVTAPRRVLAGSPLTAEVLIKAGGSQKTARIDLMEDNHLLRTQQVPVQPDSTTIARLTFTPSSAGLHRYAVNAPAADDDPAPQNNSQEFLVEVSDTKPRILYFEGEPRWEYGKLREAVAEEKNFTLVSVLRSADGKYYRQGIDKPEELSDGFPKSEEPLFKYDAVVLGSIEATAFGFDQLKSIEQFVARRGGTLLMIGGGKSFSAGGYANTPIADLLPVSLDSSTPGGEESQQFKAAQTDRGRDHPVSRMKEDSDENQKAWDHLPAITLPEILGEIKPGATTVLEARGVTDRSRVAPLLVEERYGRGRSLALMASDTWRWRMLLESSDQSFETFWRNLFRYTVESVRRRFEVATERGAYSQGERVRIKAEIDDEKFMPIRDAAPVARITSPSGALTELKMNRSLLAGVEMYAADFVPSEDGIHHIEVSARGESKPVGDLGPARADFFVADLKREYRNAAQNVELLKRIGKETGGGYYTTEESSRLVDDITHTEGPGSIRETKELWDMPINFLLLIGLAAGEWFLRKRKGLA